MRGRSKCGGPVLLDKEQLKNIFKQFDVNQDNVLSKEEIKKAFNYLGALFPGIRARLGIRYADANGDGEIDSSELDLLVKYAFELGYSVK